MFVFKSLFNHLPVDNSLCLLNWEKISITFLRLQLQKITSFQNFDSSWGDFSPPSVRLNVFNFAKKKNYDSQDLVTNLINFAEVQVIRIPFSNFLDSRSRHSTARIFPHTRGTQILKSCIIIRTSTDPNETEKIPEQYIFREK